MIKNTLFTLIIFSFGFSQTTLFGLDGWYHISTISTAGGAGAVPSPDSDKINPAGIAMLPKQIQFSMLKYPAGINAQSAMFVRSLNNSNIGIELRHLNYGNFISTNEDGIENGTYSANDLWLSASWARNNQNLNWGATGGMFFSNLESYKAVAIVFSAGVIFDYEKNDIRIGRNFKCSAVWFPLVLPRFNGTGDFINSQAPDIFEDVFIDGISCRESGV